MSRIVISLLAFCLAYELRGQSRFRFEVASIKPNSGGDRALLDPQPDGGLRAVNATPRMLITMAYEVRDFQLLGGPRWMASERYDITAKPETFQGRTPDPASLTDEQIQSQVFERLRVLLADRFHLLVHREMKEVPAYVLVVGKGGSRLQPTQAGIEERALRTRRGAVSARGIPLQMLTRFLSEQLGRAVVDETGLNGLFDFRLEWTPDAGTGSFGKQDGLPGAPIADPPSLLTAIQEQLGLQLRSRRSPVEVIVVDRLERPSPN
jgi:uncharacterized protein (TIGR03435 family)